MESPSIIKTDHADTMREHYASEHPCDEKTIENWVFEIRQLRIGNGNDTYLKSVNIDWMRSFSNHLTRRRRICDAVQTQFFCHLFAAFDISRFDK